MMGGNTIDDDWELSSPSNGARTVVLVGRTGNGKSATANSILGEKAFESMLSSSAVTETCELQRTVLRDGQIINVIDTPGLFDITAGAESIGREIVKCINMAKDGIHAVLFVLSVTNRFSEEEEAAVRSLQAIFGSRIVDYMIVVFTGGDVLDEDKQTLKSYLARGCPQPLKEILGLCENRVVLFNNKTENERKMGDQVEQLLDLVNTVIAQNGGQPYTDELFAEAKKGEIELRNQQELFGEIAELKDHMKRSYEEQLKRMTEMIESKLRETTVRLEQQLAEEQAARRKDLEEAQRNKKECDEEIRRLRERLEKAEEDGRRSSSNQCAIL